MNIVFVATNKTSLSGILFLIEKMKEISEFTPVLICDHCAYNSNDFVVINIDKACLKEEHINTNNKSNDFASYFGEERKRMYVQLDLFLHTFVQGIRNILRAKRIIKKYEPAAIIITSERQASIVQAFIKKSGGIPMFKVPVNRQEIDNSVGSRRFNLGLGINSKGVDINRIQEKISPSLVRGEREEKRCFFETGLVLSYKLLGLLPMHPWVDGASSDMVTFAYSDEEKQYILNERHKEVVTCGTVEDYYLYEQKNNGSEIQKYLREKYSIKKEEHVVILSIPHLYESCVVEWKEQVEISRYIVEYINKLFNSTVLISLHPKQKHDIYLQSIEGLDCHVLDERLRDVLAGADYLCDSNISGTRTWSDILGVPRIEINESVLSNVEIRYDYDKVFSQLIVPENHYGEIKCIPKEIFKYIK